MSDNIEQLKQQWQRLAIRTDALEEANRKLVSRLAHQRVESLQDLLYHRIKRFVLFGLVLPVLSPTLVLCVEQPVWVAVLYAVFGVLMSCIYARFARYIKEKQISDLPVVEAVERASKFKMKLINARIIGIIGGVIVIASFALTLPEADKVSLLIAAGVGLVIGLAISIPRAINTARLVKRIAAALEE